MPGSHAQAQTQSRRCAAGAKGKTGFPLSRSHADRPAAADAQKQTGKVVLHTAPGAQAMVSPAPPQATKNCHTRRPRRSVCRRQQPSTGDAVRIELVVFVGKRQATTVCVPKDCTVSTLQEALQGSLQVHKDYQQLSFRGTLMTPTTRRLSTFGIGDGDEIDAQEVPLDVQVKLPGSGPKGVGHRLLPLSVPMTSTVLDTKARVELATGIPCCQQQLGLLEDHNLRDHLTLFACGVVSAATFVLELRKPWDEVFELLHKQEWLQVLEMLSRFDLGTHDDVWWATLFYAAHRGVYHLCSEITRRSRRCADGGLGMKNNILLFSFPQRLSEAQKNREGARERGGGPHEDTRLKKPDD
eukprot:m.184051 g.184051  ORF g.184051 m.184051 type:complete len:355 (-) comp18091_c0_seq14:703-1767(-)